MAAGGGAIAPGAIGNRAASAPVDGPARIVSSRRPRFDGDPLFHALRGAAAADRRSGVFVGRRG